MWTSFYCTYVFIILVLFLPGFLFFRGIRFSSLNSVLFAPLFSISLLCIIGVAFEKLGIFASALSVGIPLLLIPGALFLLGKQHNTEKTTRADWLILGSYALIGFLAGTYLYVLPLDGSESIIQTYDNVFHYNAIQSLVESGIWSTLNVDAYLAGQSFDPFPGAEFYPAGWHTVSAFASSALHVSAPLAANGANLVFCSLVFPFSIYAIIRAVFPDNFIVWTIASIVFPIQAAFPWALYDLWPLLPNAASFCTCMLAASLFVLAIDSASDKRIDLRYLTGFFLGFIAIALLQPNSVFTLMVFLLPYLLWKTARYAKKEGSETIGKQLLYCALLLAAFAIALLALFKTPFLQATITYYWAPLYSPLECLDSIANWSLATSCPQYQVAIAVLVGCIALFAKYRDASWLALSLFSSLSIFFVVAGTPESPLKHFVGGYWYCDAYRIAAFCSIFSIPITAVGIYAIGSAITRNSKSTLLCSVCCSLVLAGITITPRLETSSSVDTLREQGYAMNSAAWNYLDNDELCFIKEVERIIPSNSLIINQPFDGSMYAFGKTGINLYYRDNTQYNTSTDETSDSRTIRRGLKEISSNSEVQSAVKNTGASYVLLLKPDFKEIGMYYSNYIADEWTGIDDITDRTPGFSLILERDGMKLYKINCD